MAPGWHDELRRRTETEFTSGVLFKPNSDAGTDDATRLAPLIVLNAERTECLLDGPVHVVAEPAGTSARRTLRVVYGWEMRCGVSATCSGDVERYGLSLSLGPDGFPVLARAARWSNGRFEPGTVFVSRSLEDAAIAKFSFPNSGRAYVIELSLAELPKQVVAGILEDGPVPMGPYVYVDPLGTGAVTILCRCSPSQVKEIVRTETYELDYESAQAASERNRWFLEMDHWEPRYPFDDLLFGHYEDERSP